VPTSVDPITRFEQLFSRFIYPMSSLYFKGRTALTHSASLGLACFLFTGCTSVVKWTGMSHGSAAGQMQQVHKVAVLPAQITINQLTAGGVSEKRDDWTESAMTHARSILENLRPGSVIYLADLDSRPELADEIREVCALVDLIDTNFMVFGLSPMAAPTAAGRFDFSVGSIDRILEAAGADALLVVDGVDEIFTADRKVLAAVSIIASAALTGSVVAPGSGQAHVSAALIARDGTVLWWNFVGDGMIKDLRTADGVRATLQRLLEHLPPATPAPETPAAAPIVAPASTAMPGGET
jgi:hypothetical protein